MTDPNSAAGLAATLKQADPDRYLSVLYAPQDKREDLIALYAFNAEIAAVRDRIREPLPGEIRLQWWRNVIASDDPEAGAGHPLAQALIGAIRRNGWPRAAFENYLEARIFDLYDDPMPSRSDLEGYLGETASVLIQLAALALDKAEAPSMAELAGHAGVAQGVAGLLRLMPLHRSRGQCYAPGNLLSALGATPADLIAGQDKVLLARIVEAMAALGREHQAKFEAGAARLPAHMRAAFLPCALTSRYLVAVAKQGAKAAVTPVSIGAVIRHWLMFRTAAQGF